MLASHGWRDGALVVTPRFPLEPGAPYRASFDGAACARLAGLATPLPSLEVELRAPAAAGEAPEVAAIYPSADELPENLLRVYVWFSRPMRSRDVGRHVILLDEAGVPVELPFVEIANGLWDPTGQRLTVFFHPGRLKRGVGPHRALGPPLRQGQRYRLEIAAEMRDASGRRLARSFAKTFSVGPAVRRALDPAGWEIRPPAAADAALEVRFAAPLDHGLLRSAFAVVGPAGELIAGRGEIGVEERSWRFVPVAGWQAGEHGIRVDPRLEDVAGNSLHQPFDRDPSISTERRAGGEVVVRFRVAPG